MRERFVHPWVVVFAVAWAATGCQSKDPGSSSGTGATGADASADQASGQVADAGQGGDGVADASSAGQPDGGPGSGAIDRVFIIMEENHPWSAFSTKPFVASILDQAAHAENYTSPGTHPSLTNYLDLEGGTSYGITDDNGPSSHRLTTHDHLANLLTAAGISWTSWQESMPAGVCPLSSSGDYATKHNPFVYFTDSTGDLDPHDPYCIAHNRLLDISDPSGEFATALAGDTISAYNFITPNLCNDAHNCSTSVADDWLSRTVPMIRDSATCSNHTCAIFIIADESADGKGDDPVICLVLSPKARSGYSNAIHYTHYSLLRTVEEIFGVTPYLANADSANDLSDLFTSFP